MTKLQKYQNSGKIDKYEYLTGKEILPLLKKMIEQAQFNCYPMGKAFEKDTKKIEDQGEKQTKINEDQRKNK